jgi:hypothetical protein
MAREWVSVNKDTEFGYTHKGEYKVVGVVKAGSVGFISKEQAVEGKVYVRFPECHWSFNKDQLVEVSPYELETSLYIIKEYEGHHTNKSGEFQFNIKFYNWNVSPLANKYLSSEEIESARWDILENELRNSFDQSWCDGSFVEDLEWVESFHTAGRMGGWLVLKNKWGECSTYFEEEQERIQNELAEEGLTDQEYIDLYAELDDLKVEANNLARELELTDYYIRYSKEHLSEYLKTEDCWERFYEHCIYEEQEQIKDSIRVADFKSGWDKLIKVSNLLDDEMPELAEELTEAIELMYRYVKNKSLTDDKVPF